jgi:hypothetical protein
MTAGIDLPTADTQAVADLINGSNPDKLLLAGDNRYVAVYNSSVGALYGGLRTANKILPAVGEQDWAYGGLIPYGQYFGVDRYYDVEIGPMHLFVLSSGFDLAYNIIEPKGITDGTFDDSGVCCGDTFSIEDGSEQWQWFVNTALASTSALKVVMMHHPPYASGNSFWGASPQVKKFGSHRLLQWEAFSRCGIKMILSGHEHSYERLVDDNDIVHVVNGLGGYSLTNFGAPVISQSIHRYNAGYGALQLLVQRNCIRGRFVTVSGTVEDEFTIE